MQLLQNLNIRPGTRVLLRAELNLPLDPGFEPLDYFRLHAALPTIKHLLEAEAKVFIISHLGKPHGQVDLNLSLSKLKTPLEDLLDEQVNFIKDPFKPGDEDQDADIHLVENLRFWPGEEEGSVEFAKSLCKSLKIDLFAQDSFATSHRAHASFVQIPKLIPSCAGLSLQKELQFLTPPNSKAKIGLIVGGAKVESKLPVIETFQSRAKHILTGGMVANTLLKSSGQNIGKSLFSPELEPVAAKILKASHKSDTLSLPQDVLVGASVDDVLPEQFHLPDLKPGGMILDIGHLTVADYTQKLAECDYIIWAGTLGYAENPAFAYGSKQILKNLLNLKASSPQNFRIVIGGGDTVDFVNSQLSRDDLAMIDHISTGGGASLLALSGAKLPGVEALEQTSSSPVKNTEQTQSVVAPILVANLKANLDKSEAEDWIRLVASKEWTGVQLKVAAPTLYLQSFQKELLDKTANIQLIAEDVSARPEGAHTGETPASVLSSVATGTLVGHSERREQQSESPGLIAAKLDSALASGLDVVLCVGSRSKDLVSHQKEVAYQLEVLSSINRHQAPLIAIAYEPVFAIGTAQVASEDFLREMLIFIQQCLRLLNLIWAPILYGGSVDEKNAKQILFLGFNGLLVGSASLDPDRLYAIGKSISS